MTVRVYRWDDASAPTLTGQLGSFITLLDAVLFAQVKGRSIHALS